MENSKFTPYTNDVLPYGFKFPQEYLILSEDISYLKKIPYFQWWFTSSTESQFSFQETIKICYQLTGKPNLLAFARNGDWAACFDLKDCSGDPKVFVYDLGNRESYYQIENFNTWLESAIKEC